MPLTQYDVVRYPSYTHAQTHPDRLRVIGSLMGLDPAAVNHCRVLELGCGDASNIVPMAFHLPGSQFAGVDLAAEPIQAGLEMVRNLGLKNMRLQEADVMAIDETWGEFDYIIAHGLFSWVPAPVREQILEICRQRLAPHGIAFISYNAYPGSHLRQMLREMLLFHVRAFEAPAERITQLIALARFLAEGHTAPDLYGQWMRAELQDLLEHAEGHLYHDELSTVNQPFYFTQFMERAAAHQLQFLAEADFFEMSDHCASPEARGTLKGLSGNRIAREQYQDFLKCRRFRQTLLCHAQRQLRAELGAQKISSLLISSAAQCSTPADLRPGVSLSYQTPHRAGCETDLPLGKAALAVLAEKHPMPLPFCQLADEAGALLNKAGLAGEAPSDGGERLREFLAKLYSVGVIELRSTMPAAAASVSARPAASALVRWQAQRDRMLTTAFHTCVQVEDEVGRNLLTWLDGSLDRNQLIEKLWEWLRAKDALATNGEDETAARNKIATELERNLAKLSRIGLLTA